MIRQLLPDRPALGVGMFTLCWAMMEIIAPTTGVSPYQIVWTRYGVHLIVLALLVGRRRVCRSGANEAARARSVRFAHDARHARVLRVRGASHAGRRIRWQFSGRRRCSSRVRRRTGQPLGGPRTARGGTSG